MTPRPSTPSAASPRPEHATATLLLAALLILALPTRAAAQGTPTEAERQRYVAATADLGCNVHDHPLSRNDAARDAANLATLRKHGYTRASYTRDVVRFVSDASANTLIASELKRCPNAPDDTIKLAGSIKGGGITGRMTLQLNAHISGNLALTIEGQNITVYLGQHERRGDVVHIAAAFNSQSGAGTLLLQGLRTGNRFAGQLRLVLTGGKDYSTAVVLEGK